MNAVQLQPFPIDHTFNICWLCLCAVLERFMAKIKSTCCREILLMRVFCFFWDGKESDGDVVRAHNTAIHRSEWRIRIVLFDLKIYIYIYIKRFHFSFFIVITCLGLRWKDYRMPVSADISWKIFLSMSVFPLKASLPDMPSNMLGPVLSALIQLLLRNAYPVAAYTWAGSSQVTPGIRPGRRHRPGTAELNLYVCI